MATTLGVGPASCNDANDAGGKKVIRVLMIGCGVVALRTARCSIPR
jgi:hypothetical protein